MAETVFISKRINLIFGLGYTKIAKKMPYGSIKDH